MRGRKGSSTLDSAITKVAFLIIFIVILYCLWALLNTYALNRAPRDVSKTGGLIIKPMFGFAVPAFPWRAKGKKKRKGEETDIAFWIILGFAIMLVVLLFLKYIKTYLDKVPTLVAGNLKRRGLT